MPDDTMPPEDAALLRNGCSIAERHRIVRDEMRRQTAKLPEVDSDGRPLPKQPKPTP